MNPTDDNQVVLERGNGRDRVMGVNPSLEVVMNLVEVIQSENGMSGPPDLVLKYFDATSTHAKPQSILYLMLAFHTIQRPNWLVNYSVPQVNGTSLILAAKKPFDTNYERRTCCGVISEYRHECMIKDRELLRRAVSWFLEHHGPCPELTWIPYDDAVQDADNTTG